MGAVFYARWDDRVLRRARASMRRGRWRTGFGFGDAASTAELIIRAAVRSSEGVGSA
jgi:hypothetical protein